MKPTFMTTQTHLRQRISTLFVLLAFCGLLTQLHAQITYTWNVAGDGAWSTPGNWTPNRNVPVATDILVINNGGAKTITSVPTQTIGRLVVSGNTDLTLKTTGPGMKTLRMVNAGTALDIQAGSSLTVTGNNDGTGIRTLTLAFIATGNVANIAGTLKLERLAMSQYGGYNANFSATTVTGTLIQNGGVINSTTSNLTFASGGTYVHAINGGTVPTATWNANSNCNITGMTGIYPSGMGQTFGNFTFSSNPTGNIDMTGTGLTCAGNLTFANANTGNVLRLVRTGVNRTISVGGNYTHSSGNIAIVSANGNGTLEVGGNFIQTGGSFTLKEDNGDALLSVTGNFIKSGGTFTQRTSGGSTADVKVGGNFTHSAGIYFLSAQDDAAGSLSVAGNFTFTGGTITEVGAGTAEGNITFNGAGTPQVYTSGGTFSQNINFNVISGAVLDIGNAHLFGSAGGFTLDGTLRMNISGNSPSDYGRVSVGGMANVNGTVAPTFTFTPAINDNFFVINPTGSHAGTPTLTITPPSITASYASGVITITGLFPIDLVYFTGKAQERSIALNWQTRQEENNDYMAVERSLDGKIFAEIGRVQGSGTGYSLKDYDLIDEHPARGLNYYRLRQVDFDGKARYHKMISVRFDGLVTGFNLAVSPNPVGDLLNATWQAVENGSVQLTILNQNGRIVSGHTSSIGIDRLEMPVQNLEKGIYYLVIRQGSEQEVVKFLKL